MTKETILKLKELERKHLEQINNPRINENDHIYHDDMVLLVHEKTNWHIYYDPIYGGLYSIAVVPGCRSSIFGGLDYFKRWYRYKKRTSPDIDKYLTKEAFSLLS